MAPLNEYQTLGAAPSVSNEQWKKLALKKMTSGYLLIINKERKFSRFYKGNGDLENCSFPIAKRLLKEGYLEEVGPHITGTLYQLSEALRDQLALSKISQTQMGAIHVIEDDDDLESEVDDMEYNVDEELTEEPIDGDGEDGDLNSTVV